MTGDGLPRHSRPSGTAAARSLGDPAIVMARQYPHTIRGMCVLAVCR